MYIQCITPAVHLLVFEQPEHVPWSNNFSTLSVQSTGPRPHGDHDPMATEERARVARTKNVLRLFEQRTCSSCSNKQRAQVVRTI